MINPLRVFRAMRILKITVEVGLVVGIIAAITPMGSAILVQPKVVSLSIMPHVLVFLYAL